MASLHHTAKHLVIDADVIDVLVELEERRLAAAAAKAAFALKKAQIDGTVRNAGSGRMLHFVSLTNMDATGPRIHDCTDVPNGVTALTDEARALHCGRHGRRLATRPRRRRAMLTLSASAPRRTR